MKQSQNQNGLRYIHTFTHTSTHKNKDQRPQTFSGLRQAMKTLAPSCASRVAVSCLVCSCLCVVLIDWWWVVGSLTLAGWSIGRLTCLVGVAAMGHVMGLRGRTWAHAFHVHGPHTHTHPCLPYPPCQCPCSSPHPPPPKKKTLNTHTTYLANARVPARHHRDLPAEVGVLVVAPPVEELLACVLRERGLCIPCGFRFIYARRVSHGEGEWAARRPAMHHPTQQTKQTN